MGVWHEVIAASVALVVWLVFSWAFGTPVVRALQALGASGLVVALALGAIVGAGALFGAWLGVTIGDLFWRRRGPQ